MNHHKLLYCDDQQHEPNNNKHEPRIDLRLAESYIPLCIALLKAWFIVSLQGLGTTSYSTPLQANVLCIGILTIDRILYGRCEKIMDTNCLAWAVAAGSILTFSHLHHPHHTHLLCECQSSHTQEKLAPIHAALSEGLAASYSSSTTHTIITRNHSISSLAAPLPPPVLPQTLVIPQTPPQQKTSYNALIGTVLMVVWLLGSSLHVFQAFSSSFAMLNSSTGLGHNHLFGIGLGPGSSYIPILRNEWIHQSKSNTYEVLALVITVCMIALLANPAWMHTLFEWREPWNLGISATLYIWLSMVWGYLFVHLTKAQNAKEVAQVTAGMVASRFMVVMYVSPTVAIVWALVLSAWMAWVFAVYRENCMHPKKTDIDYKELAMGFLEDSRSHPPLLRKEAEEEMEERKGREKGSWNEKEKGKEKEKTERKADNENGAEDDDEEMKEMKRQIAEAKRKKGIPPPSLLLNNNSISNNSGSNIFRIERGIQRIGEMI
jgi:hypothetical protein